MKDWTDPDRWHNYVVETGDKFVYITIEGITEGYTPDQARGVAAALNEAADEIDDHS